MIVVYADGGVCIFDPNGTVTHTQAACGAGGGPSVLGMSMVAKRYRAWRCL